MGVMVKALIVSPSQYLIRAKLWKFDIDIEKILGTSPNCPTAFTSSNQNDKQVACQTDNVFAKSSVSKKMFSNYLLILYRST